MTTSTWCRMSEAAEIIGVHRTTLWKWVVEGRIDRRFLLQTGTQVRIARVFCEGRHLVPTAPATAPLAVSPITFPAFRYDTQALA